MANSIFYQGKEFSNNEVKLYNVDSVNNSYIKVATLSVESPYYLTSIIKGINSKDDISQFNIVNSERPSDLQYFTMISNTNGTKFALCYNRYANDWCLANAKDIKLTEIQS